MGSNSTLCVLSQASAHNKNLDVGANIFIGNLDPEIDEKLLYDTFSAFGVILQTPKVSNPSLLPQEIHVCGEIITCVIHGCEMHALK